MITVRLANSEMTADGLTDEVALKLFRGDLAWIQEQVDGLLRGDVLTDPSRSSLKEVVEKIKRIRSAARTAVAKKKLVLADEQPHPGEDVSGTEPGLRARAAAVQPAEIVFRVLPASKIQFTIEVTPSRSPE